MTNTSTFKMNLATRDLRIRTALLVVLPLVAASSVAAEEMPATVRAVWRHQQIEFSYSGAGGVYTCAALELKLRAILKDLGARDDAAVKVQGCMDEFRSSSSTTSGRSLTANPKGFEIGQTADPRVTLIVTTLTEATPAVLREIEAARSHEELKLRVRAEGEAATDDNLPLSARRKQVRFTGNTRYLDASDCNLVEQVRANLLPRLDARVVRAASTCNRRDFSLRLGQPNVAVEILVPVPADEPARDQG
ncbi:MAG: hypothetical protein ABL964_08840 [Steroidobacteraceae bacterium]